MSHTIIDPQTRERERRQTMLDLGGMTCASCAARIERRLNSLESVEATVNYATEKATVRYDPEAVPPDRLLAAVESIGYHAAPADEAPTTREHQHEHEHDREHDAPPARLLVALALGAPLVLLAMVPALHFSGWTWVAFALATPVVFWSGAGFHRAALASARHGAATMDTLVSLGTLAAWTWSTGVLLAGLDADTYFEVAAVIT